jgi:hypothetical protein
MQFDFQPDTDGDRSSKAAVRSRRTMMISGWLVATAVAGAMAVTSCGSLNSSGGTGGKAAGGTTGSGGATSSGGATGAGGMASGAGGSSTGGAPVDAAVDAPATDTPAGDVGPTDNCPTDPNKTDPGQCGCGVADTDTDGEGVADCLDQCVNDSSKFTPGICGCGVPDVNTNDTDGDGTPDCLDECPKDATRTKRGPCGCGVADTTPLCLVHRYQFNDAPSSADGGTAPDAGAGSGMPPGTPIHDSVGTADGVAVRTTTNGTGAITLPTASALPTMDQYIQLPSGIISALGNSATFETWISWTDTGLFWQRIFDFGANDTAMPGLKGGNGNSFLFVAARGLPAGSTAAPATFTSYLTFGNAPDEMLASGVLPSATMQHVALVVSAATGDAGAPTMTLYVQGVPVMSAPAPNQLIQLNDVNNWLGRSQFGNDPSFAGTYYEFRIYSTARSAAQIQASFTAGPDTLPAN